MAVHQHIAHGKILGQTHQGVVHRCIAVGMIPAQHIAHAGGGLLKGPVGGEVVLVHGVENTPVDGLQAVPHVGQRPAHDNGHGVLDVRLLHLRHQGRLHNVLLGIPDLLRIVLGFFTHIVSPCQRLKSFQKGFIIWISSFFLLRFQDFICFSRAMAETASVVDST